MLLNPVLAYLTEYIHVLSAERNALIEQVKLDRDTAASKEAVKIQAKIRDIERVMEKIAEGN